MKLSGTYQQPYIWLRLWHNSRGMPSAVAPFRSRRHTGPRRRHVVRLKRVLLAPRTDTDTYLGCMGPHSPDILQRRVGDDSGRCVFVSYTLSRAIIFANQAFRRNKSILIASKLLISEDGKPRKSPDRVFTFVRIQRP